MAAGFFKKLFGSQPPLEKLRTAMAQKNYAEAMHLAEDLCALDEPSAEALQLRSAAGDALAHLNLEEARCCLEIENRVAALEHVSLARTQAFSPELKQKIHQLQQRIETPSTEPAAEASLPSAVGAGACSSCDPVSHTAVESVSPAPQGDEQLDLILAGYPPDLAQRYVESSPLFRQAFLLVHAGEDQQALALLEQIPAAQQDGLYWFELGSLRARLAGAEAGRPLLERALKLDPVNPLIMDALYELLMAQQDFPAVEKMLKQLQKAGDKQAYCDARLAQCALLAGDRSAALVAARKALAGGFFEGEFLVMAAGLLEAAGETSAAEAVLTSLPTGGGCGGGVNLHLAEFWLRQKRELGKALDSFNQACRQEPNNPRWQLRVAQTYLARNWRKQGLEILQRVVGDPRLEEHLRQEAQELLTGG